MISQRAKVHSASLSPILQKKQEALTHLLRGLLRECTYLPDPASRTYLHSYIVSRFRKHKQSVVHLPAEQIVPLEGRQHNHLREARKALNALSRANAGHPKPLEKVLALTYGRIGKRKYELMQFLRTPDIPSDHLAVAQLSASSSDKRNEGPRLTTRLMALAKAQKVQKASASSRPRIKDLQPQLPKTNIWLRPLPVKRRINTEKKWYAKTLDRLLPSLPEAEWERLRDLAHGRTTWNGPVLRRGVLQQVHNSDIKSRPHRLTARYMRRLWQKLFLQCSVMKWDTALSRWVVHWGYVNGSEGSDVVDHSTRSDTILFGGVDDDGKITHTTKPSSD
ncbi:hypothetical protein MMC24_007774 [Lignoscripta atroalba]|nr:hypothetical protein [Lignoscripta atroalba]